MINQSITNNYINIVILKRSDAIGMVQDQIINNLKGKIIFNKIVLDGATDKHNKLLKIFTIIKESFKLYIQCKPGLVYFLSANNYYSHLNIFFNFKKSILMVHHVDTAPLPYHHFGINFKRLYSSYDHIVSISKSTKTELIHQYGIKQNKITTIYHGCDNLLYKPISDNKFQFKYILYVGSLVKRKNVHNMIKSFKLIIKKYPELKFVRIGDDPEDKKYDLEIMTLINDLDLDKNVIFLGHVPEKDLPQYYSNAELFLFPSLKEGFGLPIIEAMSCGCPVVTSDKPPMSELVLSSQITVDPTDYKKIAQGMEKVLSNSVTRKQMIKEGKLRACDFDWRKNTVAHIELFNRFINP